MAEKRQSSNTPRRRRTTSSQSARNAQIREKRRRQRMRQVRRQYMILGGIVLAAILIILAIVSIVRGMSKGSSSEEPKAETTSSNEVQEENVTLTPTPVPTVDAPVSITVSAAGDCTLGTDENFDQSSSFDAVYEDVGDPAYFFEKVLSVFGQDDLTIVNLEGTLTTATEREDKTYAFKGSPDYTKILTTGSVEAVNLANNHSHDYGSQSYEDTIANVEAAGITSFGYERTAIKDVKGIKVGLVGIYELADGLECQTLLKEDIAKVKSDGAQLIIVSFHWGTEKENYPDDIQTTLAHTAIDEGAHLVLGHHPHVLQGIEVYKGRNIVYSLGNFCFGGNKNPSDKDTIIFQQTFSVQGDQVQLDNEKNIIPCSLSSVSDYNNYQPMILDGEGAQNILDRLELYSSGLSQTPDAPEADGTDEETDDTETQ